MDSEGLEVTELLDGFELLPLVLHTGCWFWAPGEKFSEKGCRELARSRLSLCQICCRASAAN